MDYRSKVSLHCPSCNCSSFNTVDSIITCSNCNRTFTRQQLEDANSKRIKQHIDNVVKKEVLPDFNKQLKDNLKKAFRGNPYIKIK